MPTSRLWKPFTIPQKSLDATLTSSNAPIFRLPTEILVLIFDHANPLDQFSLALVCKHLLQVSSLVSFKTSWLVGSKVTDHNETMEALLRTVKPLNKAGRRQRKAWLICIDCLQFRPTRKSYWDRKKKKNIAAAAAAASAAAAVANGLCGDGGGGGGGGRRRVERSYFWDAYISSWNDRALLQCPECRIEEQYVQPRRERIRSLGGSCPGGRES